MAGNPAIGSNPLIGFDLINARIIDLLGLPASSIINYDDPFDIVADAIHKGGYGWPEAFSAKGVPVTMTATYQSLDRLDNGVLGTVTVTTVSGSNKYEMKVSVPPRRLPRGFYKIHLQVKYTGWPANAHSDLSLLIEIV